MDERSSNNKHVEYLVALEPDVKLSRPDAFWDACSVDDSSGDVEERHEEDPAERGKVPCVVEAFGKDVVSGGNDTAQSEGNENTRADRPVLRFAELIPHGHDDAADSEDYDEDEIEDLWRLTTVEAVVQPRNK